MTREYYVNDTGNQIRMLGESVLARRRGTAVPEEGYQGEYVADLAADYDGPEDSMDAGRFAAEQHPRQHPLPPSTASDIDFDEWYTQASIEDSGRSPRR